MVSLLICFVAFFAIAYGIDVKKLTAVDPSKFIADPTNFVSTDTTVTGEGGWDSYNQCNSSRALQELGTCSANSSDKYSENKVAIAAPEAAQEAAPEAKTKFQVVFVLGGPGSGKGTNCVKIVEKFKYVHLSAGDLLRAEKESGSELAEMINSYIKEGKIVPAEVTVKLLKQAMEKSGQDKFLVDGFPRDMQNLECWNKDMPEVAEVQFLLFLDCPHDVMVERLLERGKTSGRVDDNMESIQKRLVTYEESTRPIIESFRAQGKAREVNANRNPDDVFLDVAKHFEALNAAPST